MVVDTKLVGLSISILEFSHPQPSIEFDRMVKKKQKKKHPVCSHTDETTA